MLNVQAVRDRGLISVLYFLSGIKIPAILSLSFLLLNCCSSSLPDRQTGGEIKLPLLEFSDSSDHIFTFTNKVAGFFVGHSRAENQSGFEGWTVNEFHYLKDYRIWLNGKPLDRRKVKEFRYYPHQFERLYENGLLERFVLLDSVDAFIVKIVAGKDKNQIALQPIFGQNGPQASPGQSQIDFPASVFSSSQQVRDFHLR